MTREPEDYYPVSSDALAVLADHIARWSPYINKSQRREFIRSAASIAQATANDAKLCAQGPREMFTPNPKERA